MTVGCFYWVYTVAFAAIDMILSPLILRVPVVILWWKWGRSYESLSRALDYRIAQARK